jgi:hypothetical protein
MDPREVKARSERTIVALGGKTLEWLPWLDRTEPRESAEVATRALAMHALLQIHFGAPTAVVASWLRDNAAESVLSKRERAILEAPDSSLSEQDRTSLYWYLESLWALVWAGQLVQELPINHRVGEALATLLPDIKIGEDGRRFRQSFVLRPFRELFEMLDLYYRAHWYARDGHLNGHPTGVFDLDVIMERRKALEWICDRGVPDWDETEDST